ncbi:40S ribosomal protein [Babesia ovata]|uniref:40S ribosomal protein n=1 Tax=Babesia ovata TaxID=189622 RepID=A0A2H6KE33_9APIC|nr:40S ribosomal protein [Babesia ovata]GBE61219.1 40S ribosomal protein [Babesia ovata]
MSSHGLTGFRLFYNEVVADVRAELLARLGSEVCRISDFYSAQTVPLADVQREVARLWKECPNQEEYRKKAASMAQADGAAEFQSKTETGDIVIPPHRLKRILDLDDEAPRMTKDALRTLGQATVLFLSQFAGHVDKHILDTWSSFPVKPEHIASVFSNPLYPKYQFLAGAEDKLFNSTGTHQKDASISVSESVTMEAEADKSNDEPSEQAQGMADKSEATQPAKSTVPQPPTKSRQPSILSYFSIDKTKKRPASWVKTKPLQLEQQIVKLAKKGMTPSQIGVVLRDSNAVPMVKAITNNKILRILRGHGWAPDIPEDLYFLVKKAVVMRKHMEHNLNDKDSKFRLILLESKIHRLARYCKKKRRLPANWKYKSETASALLG